MPMDKKGKFHLNTQRAMASDAMPESSMPGAKGVNVHAQSESDGGEAQESMDHLAALHGAHGGTHMHIMSHGDGTMTTHHMNEDGSQEGPHEHGDVEAMKDHIHQVFGGEDSGEQMPEEHGQKPMHKMAPHHAMAGY